MQLRVYNGWSLETSGPVQTRIWVQEVNVTRVWVRVQDISINRVRLQKSWTLWSLKETKRLSGPGPGPKKLDPLVSNDHPSYRTITLLNLKNLRRFSLITDENIERVIGKGLAFTNWVFQQQQQFK